MLFDNLTSTSSSYGIERLFYIRFRELHGYFIRYEIGHCSKASEIGIDKARDGIYTPRPNLLFQETISCADPVHMSPTPLRASSMPTTCLSPLSCPMTAITTAVPALDVGIWPIATNLVSAPCMTSVIEPRVVRLISWSRIRLTTTLTVGSIATAICPI